MQNFYYFCSVKRKLVIWILLCGLGMSAAAENTWDHINNRNELRIGWGDQLFESLVWHNPKGYFVTMPDTYERKYHEDYRYHQHLWAEYQWRFESWYSLGAMIDMSEVGWDDVVRDGTGREIRRSMGHYFYNMVLMPTMRFTYFHREYCNLYSGFGIGIGINGGTETDAWGRYTDIGAAVNLTILGFSANYDRWFCCVDIGGLTSLKNKDTIFLAMSRIFNVGIGVRF